MAKLSRTPARKPDFDIHALVKGTPITQRIGVAWLSDDGKSIHIKFEYFVDLNQCRGPEVQVTMFDRREESPRS